MAAGSGGSVFDGAQRTRLRAEYAAGKRSMSAQCRTVARAAVLALGGVERGSGELGGAGQAQESRKSQELQEVKGPEGSKVSEEVGEAAGGAGPAV